MAALADIATRTGGQILEVGFGMGISAGFISARPNVKRHIIIEANHEVAEVARKFAADASGGRTVLVLEGLWEEVIDRVDDGSCGGILFDAYPLDESEVMNQAHFARTAYRKLQPGGHFTYFSDEASGYRPEHFALLLEAGFRENNISHEIIPVLPPTDCEYWRNDTILAPILVK
jgi:guanidinoacetate N-methyltransferase